MSETKPTHGPWRQAGHMVWGADGGVVASTRVSRRELPEAKANARLIAAAPALVAACEAAFNALDDAANIFASLDAGGGTEWAQDYEAAAAARALVAAALAQARGEGP